MQAALTLFHKIINPATFSDQGKNRIAQALNRYILIFNVLVIAASLTLPLSQWRHSVVFSILITNLCVVIVNTCAWWLLRRGFVTLAANLALITLFLLATYLNAFVFRTIRSPDILIYFVLIPLTGLLLGKQNMLRYSLICAIVVSLIFYLEWTEIITAYIASETTFNDWLILIIAILLNTNLLTGSIRKVEESASETQQALSNLLETHQRLQISQDKLQQARDQLESRVAERTAELREANAKLQREVYERQQLLGDLHKSEAKWRSLVENAPEIIATIDATGTITFINRAIHGDTPAHFIGAPALRLYTKPEFQQLFQQAMTTALTSGKTVSYESQEGEAAATCWYLNRVTAIKQQDFIDEVILSILDITDQKQTEAAMHHAQKLESLGILAGGVAHDFNNLLTAMLAQSSLVVMKLAPDHAAQRNLQQIVKAAERATDLTRQMLNYAGRGAVETKPVDLNSLIADNLHLFAASIPKNVALLLDATKALPLVQGDSGQLQQLIMNLILNSADAIGQTAGQIKVTTRLYTHAEIATINRQWVTSPAPHDAYVAVEVQDTGCGMDASTLAKIFDPFFTTKFTGRGLGLASVLGIVRAHKGGLHVISSVGKGTTFQIFLPVEKENVSLVETSVAYAPASLAGCSILVIDDEDAVREATVQILQEAGCQVAAANSGRVGIELFRGQQNSLTLVLLDLSMPEMSGVEVLQELHKITYAVPVILISGYDEHEAMRRFVHSGLAGFLQKPYSFETLLQAVQRHLKPRSELPEATLPAPPGLSLPRLKNQPFVSVARE